MDAGNDLDQRRFSSGDDIVRRKAALMAAIEGIAFRMDAGEQVLRAPRRLGTGTIDNRASTNAAYP